MRTAKNRRRYDRSNLRYPSDLTGDEWGHIEPLIPPAKRGSNERHVDVREVMNGRSKLCKQRLRRGMYILSTGCQWRAIPKDLPPRSTLLLSRLVELGRHAGSHPTRTLCGVSGARRTGSQPHRGHHRQPKRERRGKRGACIDPHGYDAGKRSTARSGIFSSIGWVCGIVERTIAWLNRCRRLAKDWENLNRKALAFLRLASIRLTLRKLCNPA